MKVKTKDEVIKLISENIEFIRSFGVKRIGIFGSARRDELTEESDIDLFVEFENGRGNMKDFAGLVVFLEKLFEREVDVITPYGLKQIHLQWIKSSIEDEVEFIA